MGQEQQVHNPYYAYEKDREKQGQRSWVLDNWVMIILGVAIIGKLLGIIRVPWIVIIIPMIIYWAVMGWAITSTLRWI